MTPYQSIIQQSNLAPIRTTRPLIICEQVKIDEEVCPEDIIKNTLSEFETIKQCAINNDVEGLKRIIAGPDLEASIDVLKPGSTYLTPAAELAREGNFVAVEFLKQYGADAALIAYGFALGGYTDQTERYRTELMHSVHYIAYGFALSGHAAAADRYREEFEASIDDIARGFAMGGHAAEADRYVELGANINLIAYGFAIGGHTKHADRYHKEFGASATYIAAGFARGGHTAEVDRYLKLGANIDQIAYGYAIGGHIADAEKYHKKHDVSASFIAEGFIEAGYLAVARRFYEMKTNHPTDEKNHANTTAPYCPSRNTAQEEHKLSKVAEILVYTCPITLENMTDPVSILGHESSGSFERSAIEEWLETNDIHPITYATVTDKTLVPNTELKEKIDGFNVKKLEIK